MSHTGPEPSEAFGTWLIDRVQESTGSESIFSGDANRVRHIRRQFDEVTARLVVWVLEKERQRNA